MNLSGGSMPPVDIRDPRIRVTFADVAMRVARDGPMYCVIIVVGFLGLRGTTNALETILGAAIALQARSHPPAEDGKMSGRQVGAVVAGSALVAAHLLGCL